MVCLCHIILIFFLESNHRYLWGLRERQKIKLMNMAVNCKFGYWYIKLFSSTASRHTHCKWFPALSCFSYYWVKGIWREAMNASAHKAVFNSVSLPNTFMTKVTNLRSWMDRGRFNAECMRGVLICCITLIFSFWCKNQCNSRLQTHLGTVDFMTTDLNSGEDPRVQILVTSCRHFKELGAAMAAMAASCQSLAQVHASEWLENFSIGPVELTG